MRARHLLITSAVAAILACGGSSPTALTNGGNPGGGTTVTPDATVSIRDFTFSPETVTVKVGQTVQWDNNGPSPHAVTSDSAVFHSGTMSAPGGGTYNGGGSSSGGSYQFTFNSAGTFPYHCSIHPPSAYPNFRGVVIVTP